MKLNSKALLTCGSLILLSSAISSCEDIEAPSIGLKQTVCVIVTPEEANIELVSGSTSTTTLDEDGCTQIPYDSNLVEITANYPGYQEFNKTYDTSEDGFQFIFELTPIATPFSILELNTNYSF